MTNPNNLPLTRSRVGRVSASAWRNTTEDGQSYIKLVVERSYRDQSGQWHTKHDFRETDIPALRKALDRIHDQLLDLIDTEREQSRSATTSDASEPVVQQTGRQR